EEVKTVNIGNEMKVTLSIGIGVNGSTYAQNYEFSRIAIELALGRGGDQAVVKDNDKISYYGGKSQQMEKSTRVKARVKAHALREFIGSHEDVVIMGHKITDIDSFGAAVGVWRAARILDKKAHIVLGDINGSIRQWVNLFLNDKEYPEDMFVTHEQARKIVDHDTVVVVVDTNRPSMTECSEILNQTRTIVVLDH
ncbi:signaling protein consisting of a modified GGDEF domain protein and a DHH domain protein, partial [human gut metagenome]